MTNRASGTFEVKLSPQDDKTGDPTLGRMSLDKQFHGDLEATSKGQMLTAGTAVQGSAGYVAIERVSGTLKGRSGSFALQHSGTMTRGTPQLTITVVPDSGTGQLAGSRGQDDDRDRRRQAFVRLRVHAGRSGGEGAVRTAPERLRSGCAARCPGSRRCCSPWLMRCSRRWRRCGGW